VLAELLCPKCVLETHFLGRGVPDIKHRIGAPCVVSFPSTLSHTVC